MPIFALTFVPARYNFEIAQDKHGLWQVLDKGGLIGGVFLTQRDALRFALFEAAGDDACVRVLSEDKSAVH